MNDSDIQAIPFQEPSPQLFELLQALNDSMRQSILIARWELPQDLNETQTLGLLERGR